MNPFRIAFPFRTALLGIGLVASAAMPALAEYGRRHAPRVVHVRPTFEQCHHLALQRGLNVSRGDLINMRSFIAQCQAGKIPF